MNDPNIMRTVLLPLSEWQRIARGFANLAPRWRRKDEALRLSIVRGLDDCIRSVDNPAPLAIDRPDQSWTRLIHAAECWGINVWSVAQQAQSLPSYRDFTFIRGGQRAFAFTDRFVPQPSH
ncbi:MAG: hypothetical protein AB7G12_12595 [Thermoanaerobaculia bacterium]